MDVQTVMNQMSADNADAVDASDTLYGLLAKAGSTPTCPKSTNPAGPQYAYNWYYGASTTCDTQDPAASFLAPSLSQFDYEYTEPDGSYGCNMNNSDADGDGADGGKGDGGICHHYGTITDFIQQCVTRNITNDTNDGLYDNKEYWVPMGEYVHSDADDAHKNGDYSIGNGGEKDNGAFGSSSTNCSINFGVNKLLYNYLQFFRVNNAMNQGSQLGSQADGSATS